MPARPLGWWRAACRSCLVGADASALGAAVSSSPDREGHERLLAVVVGDPDDPAVMLAAEEMAGELWQWARGGGGARD